MEQPNVIEKYYAAKDVAFLLGFCTKWVVERMKRGEFGPRCFYADGDYRITASGVNAFIERHTITSPAEIKPIAARTEGELRRKLAVQTSARAA